MGRKAILAALCWLTFSQVLGDKSQSAVKDNESVASAPRLYRNVPVGVYASAAPYAAYSFQLPQFISAPKAAASQVAPVKQTPGKQNVNTYLMDSYGNRFYESPQQAPYKAAFTQQYVSLQPKLPEHLAQPLVAASPNFQFKQSGPQVFFGAPFRVPALQSPAPTPLNHFPSFGHLVYADKVQTLAPTSNAHNHGFKAPTAQQQSTNNKAVFSHTQSHEQYNNIKNEPKFQRQQEPQIIVGKPKLQNVQETLSASHGETKLQRIKEIPHGEVKFQRIQEKPSAEPKFQPVQEGSYASYDQAKFQRLQENPHVIHNEGTSHRIQELPHNTEGGLKYQRLQESPQIVHVEHHYERVEEGPKHQDGKSHSTPSDKAQLQSAPAKQTTITYVNDVNGKTSVVKVKSEPLPLLDLTLLEPLTFANPLVPQVQHFLPRINQATYQKLPVANLDNVKNYQKEFVVQKTMSYDSGNISEKPQKHAHKKKEKKPTYSSKHAKKNDAPQKTSVTHSTALDDAPEIVYEINAPGHKETYKEKVLSYNKETQSEPVHYSYGSQTEKDPVNYSYTRTSKDPVQTKEVHYHSNSQDPSHLIYNFKPEEQHKGEHVHNNAPHSGTGSHKEFSRQSENDGQRYHHHHNDHNNDHPKPSQNHHEPTHNQQGHYYKPSQENQHDGQGYHHHHNEHSNDHSNPSQHHDEPVHNQQEHYYGPTQENQHESLHADPSKYYSPPRHNTKHFTLEPITKEYEEDIRLLANAQIKVDPGHEESPPHQRDEQSHAPHRHHHSSLQKHSNQSPAKQTHHHYSSSPHSESHGSGAHGPGTHVQEKSKRIIIQEEAPDERHVLTGQLKEEVVDQEENSEEDFEKAYKNAAIGFPAYSQEALEAAEKDIFDPESYGVPPDHVEYDVENTPFKQYVEEGDEFPKESRASYKDARDKMKEDYYTDYSISKPESLLDRYQNKLGYYKLYKQQKPDYYVPDDDGDDKKKQKSKFAKYTAAPTFDFPSSHAHEEKGKSYYGSHKPKQQLYEYDYSKGAPRDNKAFASRPLQRYKSKTNFVEPQFQYGFEPISIPKLLDSELAAMASSFSPESEKPGTRKKVYKENWYLKKTSTAAGAPAS